MVISIGTPLCCFRRQQWKLLCSRILLQLFEGGGVGVGGWGGSGPSPTCFKTALIQLFRKVLFLVFVPKSWVSPWTVAPICLWCYLTLTTLNESAVTRRYSNYRQTKFTPDSDHEENWKWKMIKPCNMLKFAEILVTLCLKLNSIVRAKIAEEVLLFVFEAVQSGK